MLFDLNKEEFSEMPSSENQEHKIVFSTNIDGKVVVCRQIKERVCIGEHSPDLDYIGEPSDSTIILETFDPIEKEWSYNKDLKWCDFKFPTACENENFKPFFVHTTSPKT